MQEKTVYAKLASGLVLEIVGSYGNGEGVLLHTLRKEGEAIQSKNTYRVPHSNIVEQSRYLDRLLSKDADSLEKGLQKA